MGAFKFAHRNQGDIYLQEVFEYKEDLTRNDTQSGAFHTKLYKGVKISFVIPVANTLKLIDVVEPFYPGQPIGKQRGWGVDETKVNTMGLLGRPVEYPYSIAIFAGGSGSKSNERLATVFFSDIKMYQQWKGFVSGK